MRKADLEIKLDFLTTCRGIYSILLNKNPICQMRFSLNQKKNAQIQIVSDALNIADNLEKSGYEVKINGEKPEVINKQRQDLFVIVGAEAPFFFYFSLKFANL